MATRTGPRPVAPVAIIADLLDRVSAAVEGGGPVDVAALADLRRARDLARGLDPYLATCTTPASPALQDLDARTAAEDWRDRGGLEPEMLSGHVEGQALALLVRATRARRVLDVGTFTGYSALAMAEALPEDGEVVACELDPDVAAIAQAAFDDAPCGGRIRLEVGPAIATLRRLADQGARFDLAFVDADKGGYVDYLGVLLDGGLIRPGGLICADNTLMQGCAYLDAERDGGDAEAVANGRAIDAFNRALAEDPRVDQVLLPLRDGLTLAVVREAAGG